MAISNYNTDPDLNTSISGINIAEGCPPSGINNAIRQMMADIVSDLLQLSGGTMTGDIQSGEPLFVIQKTDDSGTLIIRGGSGYGNGANLYLRGKDHPTEPGWMYGHTTDGNISTDFFMKPDGTFTWGGKNVERLDSSSSSYGNGYIRFVNGLQICWGAESISAAKAVSFPKAFNVVTNPVMSVNTAAVTPAVSGVSTTGFTASLSSYSGTPNIKWIAVGTWK